ncbi:MAG: 50S ribosomal protein L18 [Candidatus Pacearchaeota archaeon]|nr:50S ribosomal protein L18 [Nanoarchaeota archaeon]MDZ4226528.1 50S ribosomal protein L18 [Candidatus Pacearchaeota archaeon]
MKTLKRRRMESKTDYGLRIKLLKAEVPRVIFRKSNRYIIAQYVMSNEARDSIVTGVTSRILMKYGWPEDMKGSLKSLPASYLTGFFLGKKITEKKLETPIIDMGMIRSVNKGRVFSFIRGLIDAGVEIKCSEESFPSEERIKGKNLKRDFTVYFSKIKSKIGEK